MSDFTISIVQANLHWEQPADNRAQLAELLASALDGGGLTDLVVLPEMFTTGFTMAAATQAEPTDGPTLAWMRSQAAHYDAVVTGSVLVGAGGQYYNRLLWVRPDGSFSCYDKRHLFRLAGEHEVFTPGTQALVEEWRGWRIRPLVPYDLLLYVANWPQQREEAWTILLRARAIENLAYVAGVNRLGPDGKGVAHSGQSAILNMTGGYLARAGNMQTVLTRTLQAEALHEYRRRMPALLDADEFEMTGK